MSISTTDPTVNQCAAITQLSLSIFQLVEALLHRIKSEVDEERDVLSFQICVLLTSLLDVHAAQKRKHQSLSWIEKNKGELFSSSQMRETIIKIHTLIQQTDLSINKECMDRLDELKVYYQNDPIKPEAEQWELKTQTAVSEPPPIVNLQHIEVTMSSSQTNVSASPPLMFTQRERKRKSKR